jgi:hypothetical protein
VNDILPDNHDIVSITPDPRSPGMFVVEDASGFKTSVNPEDVLSYSNNLRIANQKKRAELSERKRKQEQALDKEGRSLQTKGLELIQKEISESPIRGALYQASALLQDRGLSYDDALTAVARFAPSISEDALPEEISAASEKFINNIRNFASQETGMKLQDASEVKKKPTGINLVEAIEKKADEKNASEEVKQEAIVKAIGSLPVEERVDTIKKLADRERTSTVGQAMGSIVDSIRSAIEGGSAAAVEIGTGLAGIPERALNDILDLYESKKPSERRKTTGRAKRGKSPDFTGAPRRTTRRVR